MVSVKLPSTIFLTAMLYKIWMDFTWPIVIINYLHILESCYIYAGAKLKGGYGGVTNPPTPDLAGHRGSFQGKNVVSVSITDCVSIDVGEIVDVGRKFFRVYDMWF